MMKSLFIAIVFTAFFALSGCATTEGYKKILDSWLGMSEHALISQWGVPVRSYESNGILYLVYDSRRTITLPGSSPTYTSTIIGNTIYTDSYGGSSPTTIHKQCITTFQLRNGKIFHWLFRGNDCRAYE